MCCLCKKPCLTTEAWIECSPCAKKAREIDGDVFVHMTKTIENLAFAVRDDIRQCGPFKITPSRALQKALMAALSALGDWHEKESIP